MPQLAAPWSWHVPVGSVPPAGTGLQLPALLLRAQERQVPVQPVAQQTPWAQMVLPHSPPAEQIAPLGLSPHDPLMQLAGAAQSASFAHVALQALVSQANGKHEVGAGTTQVPAPSHDPPAVKVVPLAAQLAFAHEVPCGYFSQAPAWHLPSVAQLVPPWSAHEPAGSGPETTAVHWPIVPVMAHD